MAINFVTTEDVGALREIERFCKLYLSVQDLNAYIFATDNTVVLEMPLNVSFCAAVLCQVADFSRIGCRLDLSGQSLRLLKTYACAPTLCLVSAEVSRLIRRKAVVVYLRVFFLASPPSSVRSCDNDMLAIIRLATHSLRILFSASS